MQLGIHHHHQMMYLLPPPQHLYHQIQTRNSEPPPRKRTSSDDKNGGTRIRYPHCRVVNPASIPRAEAQIQSGDANNDSKFDITQSICVTGSKLTHYWADICLVKTQNHRRGSGALRKLQMWWSCLCWRKLRQWRLKNIWLYRVSTKRQKDQELQHVPIECHCLEQSLVLTESELSILFSLIRCFGPITPLVIPSQ